MTRDKPSDGYVCFYKTHYAGGVVKTFLGGGVYAANSADQVADNLLASLAQDIAERWNSTMRSKAIEMLESCLTLTQSNCAVPSRFDIAMNNALAVSGVQAIQDLLRNVQKIVQFQWTTLDLGL